MRNFKVGLIVPTLNAGKSWPEWLAALARQSLRPDRILIVDSASTDQTVPEARAAGLEVLSISRADFNHGGTRHMAALRMDDCDLLIFLTQDAILVGTEALADMVAAFVDPKVAMAYGRQLPYPDAGAIGAHARLYNYGDVSVNKSIDQVGQLGLKTIFCSNSFSAYRRDDYLALGGFKTDLIFGEDAHFAGRLVLQGKVLRYVANAQVYHSHDYSLREDARRYFDIGVFHTRDNWMLEKFGGASGEGMRFIKSELRYLLAHAPLQLPSAVIRTFLKYGAYRLGRAEASLPLHWKRKLSMNGRYWK